MSIDRPDKLSPKIEIDPDVLEEAASIIETKDVSFEEGIDLQDALSDETLEVSHADETLAADIKKKSDQHAKAQKPQSDDKTQDTNLAKETSGPDYKNQFVRLSADFDNFRKRTFKEKTDYIKYGNESLLKDLLPIMDNFERALDSSSESDATSILQGVQMIFLQLTQTLEKFGLKGQDTKGQNFDPNLHEAMSNIEDESHPPNTVIEQHQKLYRYHEKLLRPALVTVTKPKA